MDHIKLIDAARRWRAPEHRDQAEIDLDLAINPPNPGGLRAIDPIAEIHYDSDDEGDECRIEVICESGIQINIPCNF